MIVTIDTKAFLDIELIARYSGGKSVTLISGDPEPLVKALYEVIKWLIEVKASVLGATGMVGQRFIQLSTDRP